MAARRTPTTSAPKSVTRCFRRWTRPREAVFGAIVRARHPVSATDLFTLVRRSSGDVGLTTVYRTLDVFARAGLVRRMSTQSGETRFEYRRGARDDHHGHLVCSACRKVVTCFDSEGDVDALRRSGVLLGQKHGFLVRDHNIDFIGLCSECRSAGAGPGTRPATRTGTAARPRSASRARSRKDRS